MKATILTSVLAVILSVANVSAANPYIKVFSNIEVTETGTIKEFIKYDESQSIAIDKCVYTYDAAGNMLKKATYKWDSVQGWVAVNKYDYNYNEDGRIAYTTYTEWDSKINYWASTASQLIHIYDNSGNLMAIKQIQVNEDANFMSMK
ncbi:DUF3836 domain-containing protein [Dysgonomonas sp. 511]|uniref:DUF3836 domain-containing protein n=1 Tax=Dysgonomonas sp. 511 TaxID=2302930 RepID=UPI0013D03E04|nr:DUF3836 domain-containing protein [Dysgonomonas sp. 511]NDV78451.1 DUF3836 domain-containing protein [Dysgonomonas sp. 511]